MTSLNDTTSTTRITPPDSDIGVAAELAMISRTEQAVASTYPHGRTNAYSGIGISYVRNPANENRVLLDQNGRPVSVDRMLATKPLRQDLSTRPGPGGRRLTYMSGDGVSRSLNEIFGYEGWSLDIKSATQTGKEQDKRGRWQVSYLSHVRITLVASGAYKEDMGSGDSTDNNLQTAVAHAMKASITDALKRTARHFGDKLGNSLYDSDFAINKAPTNLFEALTEHERGAREKWGSLNVPKAQVENHRPNGSVPSAVEASKMPPPPPPLAVNHNSTAVPTVTPNMAAKQGNVYQRSSAGSHSIAAVVSKTASSFGTPRVSTDASTAAAMHPTIDSTQTHHQTRPILSETLGNVDSASRPMAHLTTQTHLHQAVVVNKQPSPMPRQTLVRPTSSWGKRPGGETTETAKRPRHNPYA